MTANLQNPIFTDETKAREWLEARVWPQGPVCPHCGATGDEVTAQQGKAHRPGLYQCSGCREQFTVTVKTVFERSKIPLSKWLAASVPAYRPRRRKAFPPIRLHRSLGISYKSSWFMMHRLARSHARRRLRAYGRRWRRDYPRPMNLYRPSQKGLPKAPRCLALATRTWS